MFFDKENEYCTHVMAVRRRFLTTTKIFTWWSCSYFNFIKPFMHFFCLPWLKNCKLYNIVFVIMFLVSKKINMYYY